MDKRIKRMQIGLVALFIALAIILPAISFAKHTKKIYVNSKAGSTQDGSSSHPYKTIKQALDKSKEKTEIHVSSGVYVENIVIPEGVSVYGEDKDDVVIAAKHDSFAAVEMHHKTVLSKVTVKDGKYGVLVGKNDRALIQKSIIKDNEKDGIYVIASSKLDDKHAVSIIDNKIVDNGNNGVYSESRRIVLTDNEINDNKENGLELKRNSKAWMENNDFEGNKANGIKVSMDNADVWMKKNTFYRNKKDGLRIETTGKVGRIDVNESKFYRNQRYGISKVGTSDWKGLTVQKNVIFSKNLMGSAAQI